VGDPTIKGAMITGKVLSHPKGDKVHIFKKKKRKGYRVHRGHRQFLTEIQIQDIVEKGAPVKAGTGAEAKSPTKTKPGAKATAEEAKAVTGEKPTKGDKTVIAAEKQATAEKKAIKTTAKPASKPAAKTTAKPAAKSSAKPAAKKSTGTGQKKPGTDKK
jgi:large subunit ribosomal protein L21